MNEQQKSDEQLRVSRRQLLAAGGVTLLSAALIHPSSGASPGGGPAIQDDIMRPVILPKPGSKDPVDLSVAENAFWNEQLMEHAKFFIMLMPGAELAAPRREAERFQRSFAAQLQRSKTARIDKSNYAAFNRSTIEAIKPFADWKRRMSDLQASGKLKSLTWSTFFDHTALEAERFARRLEQFSRGDTSTGMKESAGFWTQIMGDHADFIAHLLDPAERDLILKAMRTADGFHKMHKDPSPRENPLEKAVSEIIDFKTAAEKGIQTGKIKSIIHPALADHVRREAIKAADDLRRAI